MGFLWFLLAAGAVCACIGIAQDQSDRQNSIVNQQKQAQFLREFQRLLALEFPSYSAFITEVSCDRYVTWRNTYQTRARLAPHVNFFDKAVKPASRLIVAHMYAAEVAPLFAPQLAAAAAQMPELFFDKFMGAYHTALKLSGL